MISLCTREVVQRQYASLSSASSAQPDGADLHLYSALLSLLLRLSSLRGADPDEISRRTKEVLDQFGEHVSEGAVSGSSRR